MITENLSTLKIHKLTQEQYDREYANGNIDKNALYLTPDEEIDLSDYVTIEQLNTKANAEHNHNGLYYTEAEVDVALSGKADVNHDHNSVYETKENVQLKFDEAKSYTDTKTSGLASTSSVTTTINTHNTSTSAHSDIRTLITGLTNRLNALADSDDTTLDQLSEIVAYIKSNKSLIDAITTSKVNVSDIVNNLTTSATNKPLSAAQGVAIKVLIDALQAELDSHTHAISDVTNLQSTLDGKAGKKVDGQTTTLDGVSYVGGTNAEVFNDYEANVATGAYSHAEGCYNKATGDYSHAEGAATTASGYAGHTEGYQTKALGASSHAEGKNTAATGQTAHAEGNSSTMLPNTITPNSSVSDVETAWNSAKFTLARGTGSHAEGSNTLALNTAAHSEGNETIAKGSYSHAQGYKTVASGGRAHAEGQGSVASGNDSHAEGAYTIAAGDYQHVQGKYNVEDASGVYAHIVGGGTNINSRSNINTLDWSGNAWFKGDIYVGGTGQDDGQKVLYGTAGTSDLTAGSSSLATGAIYQVYS